jgi:zinc-ribbon domain
LTDQTCPQCGAPVPDGATFCTSCGTRLADGRARAAGSDGESGRGEDVTRVEQPGLEGETRVLPETAPPAPDPWSGPPASPPPTEPPATFAPPPPPTGRTTTPPDQAWSQPAGGPPSSWGSPPPTPASWDQPGAPAAASWPTDAAGATTRRSDAAPAPASAIVGILGALLTILGLFLPWVSASTGTTLSLIGDDDSLTGWALATKSQIRIKTDDPYWLLALGIIALAVAVVLFVRAVPALRIALAVLGLAIVGLTIYDLSSIRSVVEDTFTNEEKINFQLGLWLTLAGGIVCIVAACLPAAKRRAPVT